MTGNTSGETTEIIIDVVDTGIGIKEQDIDSVFAEFDRVDSSENQKFEETGLGLAISRRLIELMNGRLSVISTYGKGSTFTATLPLPECAQRLEHDNDNNNAGKSDLAPKETGLTILTADLRILVAEDNKTNQFAIKKNAWQRRHCGHLHSQ